ncbi:MAG: hypothetical protein IKM66_06805 [Clostridia bacterium]|nr:hypothetical protein [Clostridia bacterium]
MAVNENRGINANGLSHLLQGLINLFVKKEDGKGLSSNDYTLDEKVKLAGIDTGANKTVVSDSLSNPSSTDALSANQGKELNDKINAININMGNLGGGDMMKSAYDTDGDGKVNSADNADKLGGVPASEYVKQTDIENLAPGKHNHEQSDINGLSETVAAVTNIANGKCKTEVFDTVDAMNVWLANSENTKELKTGDVFLIRAVDVPDYWWDGSSAQVLETTKISIEFLTNDEIDEILGLATN